MIVIEPVRNTQKQTNGRIYYTQRHASFNGRKDNSKYSKASRKCILLIHRNYYYYYLRRIMLTFDLFSKPAKQQDLHKLANYEISLRQQGNDKMT